MNNMDNFSSVNGYDSIYRMNDLPKIKHVPNPYKICFILNLVSILVAGIPSVLGILYFLFWFILGLCTLFVIWITEVFDPDFFGAAAKFGITAIPFFIISLTLNVISLKPSKEIPDNILMLITSYVVLFFDIVWGVCLIIIRKQICSHFGNVIFLVFLILIVAGISCAVLSIIENYSIKKSRK